MITAYIRVSSKAQDHASQRAAIERACANVDAWYAEKASAKTTDRAELKRLLADVRAGKVRELYVFKLDRLARTGVADTFAIVDTIRRAGATLHAIADGLVIKPGEDVTSDVLVFALGLAAKLERTAINDRIAAARARMASKGEAWGRPRRMTPAQVTSAKRMKASGKTVREISAALGVPRATVGRALQ
ncbi:MAG TPA: recombinase family protein [Polyangiaceae bacterium]